MLDFATQNENCVIPKTVKPISSRSKKIFLQREHVLIGVSPFNSYYSELNIFNTINWVNNHFKSFNIFIPDTLPLYTLLALGIPLEKAEKKARRQANYTLNKTMRALDKIPLRQAQYKNIIVSMNKLNKDDTYAEILDKIYQLFNENSDFQTFCIKATKSIIAEKNIDCMNAHIAVNYFLRELPLLINTPQILSVPNSLFVYHAMPESICSLFNSHLFDLVSCNQGYLCVNVE